MKISQPILRVLPNLLSAGRVVVIPVIVPLYMISFQWLNVICALLFAIAALTDYFDGYLARRYNLVSPFGAALDQIADKLIVTCCLILLSSSGTLTALVSILLIGREIFIMGMRHLAKDKGIEIAVSDFGKAKTLLQDVGIFCLFINLALFPPVFRHLGMIALWIAIGLSYYSAYLYWESFWPSIKHHFNTSETPDLKNTPPRRPRT